MQTIAVQSARSAVSVERQRTMSSPDDIWDLVEFCALEAFLLRSFVEYLDKAPTPWERKLERLTNWKKEIGLQLGNPKANEHLHSVFQRVRDARPEARYEVLQKALAPVRASYFGEIA